MANSVVETPSTSNERGGRVYSAAVPGVLALLGGLVAVNGLRLGLGADGEPGPGLWPFAIGVVWTVAAIVVAISGWRLEDRLAPVDGLRQPLIGLGLTVVFIQLFSYVGFVVAIVATLLLWLRLLTDLDWRRTLAAVVSITVILYVLFVVVVHTALPDSLIGLG